MAIVEEQDSKCSRKSAITSYLENTDNAILSHIKFQNVNTLICQSVHEVLWSNVSAETSDVKACKSDVKVGHVKNFFQSVKRYCREKQKVERKLAIAKHLRKTQTKSK